MLLALSVFFLCKASCIVLNHVIERTFPGYFCQKTSKGATNKPFSCVQSDVQMQLTLLYCQKH